MELHFSKDGERMASVGGDGRLKVVDVHTGRVIYSVNGFYHANAPGVSTVAFSPDDACIAFGADDNAVKIIDGETGAELKSLKGHESTICTVAFARVGKRIVSGGVDKTVRIWDLDSGQEMATLRGHAGRVNGVAFSPDGTRVVSACEDLTIKIWDAQSGEEIKSLAGHVFNVASVAFSPDGNQIATSSSDHTIRIWDAQSGEEISRLEGHVAGVTGLVYSPDGKRIASTGFDRRLKLWDVSNGREISTIHEDHNGVHGVAFSPDGRRIAAGMDDGAIMFFDAPREREVTSLSGHTDTVVEFCFSEDGRRIYSESRNVKLVWDLAIRSRAPDSTWNPPTTRTKVSPDGRWLINGDRNNLLLIDLDYKNTPLEKNYRAAKAGFDAHWHRVQAAKAANANNWYAATFHYAVLRKNDPDRASYSDGLHRSFEELKSQFELQRRDLEPHLAMFVKESLQVPRGNELPNASFEEPEIRKMSFEFREAIPAWKTTARMLEIWSTGFLGVKAHDGVQFVELNAREEGTLYQDRLGIEQDAVLEFSFAHRGRNGNDTLKLTITDLGADNAAGGGDDQELFAKEYTTGNSAWAVYDSTTEPAITALGNKVRFAYSAVSATGGKGPDKTEGNFLDAAYFGVGVVTAKRKAYGVK